MISVKHGTLFLVRNTILPLFHVRPEHYCCHLNSCLPMPSDIQRRLRLAQEVALTGTEMAPCSRCRSTKTPAGEPAPRCIVGPRSGRCSECIRKGYAKCDVTLELPDWISLRNTRDRLRKELESIEEHEAMLLHRLSVYRARKARLRARLRSADDKVEDAVAEECLELERTVLSENETFAALEEVQGLPVSGSVPSVDGPLEMPLSYWNIVSPGPDGYSSFDPVPNEGDLFLFAGDPTDPLGDLFPLESVRGPETSAS